MSTIHLSENDDGWSKGDLYCYERLYKYFPSFGVNIIFIIYVLPRNTYIFAACRGDLNEIVKLSSIAPVIELKCKS